MCSPLFSVGMYLVEINVNMAYVHLYKTKQQMIKKNVFYRNGSPRGKSRFDCKVDYDYPVLVCECFLIDQRICFCFLLTFQLNKQTKSNRTKERGRKRRKKNWEKKKESNEKKRCLQGKGMFHLLNGHKGVGGK